MKKISVLMFLFIAVFSAFGEELDTIRLRKNQILILQNSIVAPKTDTIYLLEKSEKYKIRRNPYNTSEKFYRTLSEKTGTNKITKKFADLFLVRTDKKTDQAANAGLSNDIQFALYEGLIIRSIKIKHVDILEGSVFDTARVSSRTSAILANKFHTDTRDWVVKSNLRIAVGQRIDPILLADNERFLRRAGYIEDAKIYVTPNIDEYSADVVIYVKDRLSWGFEGHVNNQNQGDFKFYNRNIAGFGRYASVGTYYSRNKQPVFGQDYRIGGQNSLKNFTSWEINETNSWDRNDYGITVQKEFLTPSIKYGGGMEIRTVRDSTLFLDGELGRNKYYKLNFQDFWFGRSFQLPSKFGRKTLIFSTRILSNEFVARPPVSINDNELYYNRVLWLNQIAYAKQRFIKSSYVLGFGVSEDIPVGFRASALYGKDVNEFFRQDYFGGQFFWSKYYKSIGYFYASQEFGGYYRNDFKNGVLKTQVSYFAPLWIAGRSRIRSFANFGVVNGINQSPSQTVSLDGRIRDINGFEIEGNRLLFLRSETILFTPWYLLGFRFAPFVYGSYSQVGDRREINYSNSFISGGVGIRLKNESLVFNTFEARFTNFFLAPNQSKNPVFTISVSTPIAFGNIFKYKPRLIAFE